MSIVSLRKEKAKRSNNPADWTVAECLQDALEAIEYGRINPSKVYIAMSESGEDNTEVFHYRTAQTSGLEAIGLLMAHVALKTRGE